ncbi:MAG: metallopeptidase family protein [Thermoguttaceae bacterium]|nr:metallopeptidase family protein [Thermoguttaceae bacterium]MDW8078684.1 metallopeptidase family protein [Thermoguttaceae bacterium]
MGLSKIWRKRFDRMVERVLQELPPSVQKLLEEVPLHVEDHPSRKLMRQMGVERRDELCGLFTGVPMTEQSISTPIELPPFVTIYREGILAATREIHGRITPRTLREQIRVTLLHELAHYHGLNEEELEELGYE